MPIERKQVILRETRTQGEGHALSRHHSRSSVHELYQQIVIDLVINESEAAASLQQLYLLAVQPADEHPLRRAIRERARAVLKQLEGKSVADQRQLVEVAIRLHELDHAQRQTQLEMARRKSSAASIILEQAVERYQQYQLGLAASGLEDACSAAQAVTGSYDFFRSQLRPLETTFEALAYLASRQSDQPLVAALAATDQLRVIDDAVISGRLAKEVNRMAISGEPPDDPHLFGCLVVQLQQADFVDQVRQGKLDYPQLLRLLQDSVAAEQVPAAGPLQDQLWEQAVLQNQQLIEMFEELSGLSWQESFPQTFEQHRTGYYQQVERFLRGLRQDGWLADGKEFHFTSESGLHVQSMRLKTHQGVIEVDGQNQAGQLIRLHAQLSTDGSFTAVAAELAGAWRVELTTVTEAQIDLVYNTLHQLLTAFTFFSVDWGQTPDSLSD